MALLDDVVGSWAGGVVVGLGAAVFAPSIVPLARSILRPVVRPLAKTVISAGLVIGDTVSEMVSATATSESKESRRSGAAVHDHGSEPVHH